MGKTGGKPKRIFQYGTVWLNQRQLRRSKRHFKIPPNDHQTEPGKWIPHKSETGFTALQILGLKPVYRRPRKNYVKSSPEITAETILNREFQCSYFGEKWLDVTQMKYGSSGKAYLSAILDLADKSIVFFVIGHSNNNELVFETFDIAHTNYPEAKPWFHSDRGYQYTSKAFKKKLDEVGMVQSMSRVSRCIDNGPMEAFWGMMNLQCTIWKSFVPMRNWAMLWSIGTIWNKKQHENIAIQYCMDGDKNFSIFSSVYLTGGGSCIRLFSVFAVV